MTFEEFKEDVFNQLKNKPDWSRNGQFVFNYIDEKYGVVRAVQFIDNIDCFYDDSLIIPFIIKSYEQLKYIT